MNVALGSVGVAASTRPEVADGLAPCQSVLGLPIVRVLAPHDGTSLALWLLPPRWRAALVTLSEQPGASGGETRMAEEQGRGMGTGRPALNIERIYRTTVTAEEIARALADHFRAQEFEAQVYRTSGDRTVMQARKESLWRQLLGVTYALTVVLTPGEGQLSIGLGGHEWVDAAVSGAIGLVAVPPVLLGTAYGIWKENQLDKEVWQVIDKAVGASDL
jgi:hypothetical protein